jgi:hypothetical protein
MHGVNQLRKKLDEIVEPPADAEEDWLDRQIDEIEKLKTQFPHGIELYQKASIGIANTNCYMYALGMSYDSIEDFITCRENIPDSKFSAWLISSGILLPSNSDFLAGEDGSIVMYFLDDTFSFPTHAGIKAGNKVVSKWGWGGVHIWKHPPREAPARYGSYIKLYNPRTRDEVGRAYASWLHEQPRNGT